MVWNEVGRVRSEGALAETRSGSLSTTQRRVLLVGAFLMLSASAAFVCLASDRNTQAVDLQTSWLTVFQKQKGSAAQTKQFLAAMDAGAEAAEDANNFLGSEPSTQPHWQPQVQVVGGEPAASTGLGDGPIGHAEESQAAGPHVVKSTSQPGSEITSPEEVTETPYVSSPSVMQRAPLPQDGVGLVESVVSPQVASAAGGSLQMASPLSQSATLPQVVSGAVAPSAHFVSSFQPQLPVALVRGSQAYMMAKGAVAEPAEPQYRLQQQYRMEPIQREASEEEQGEVEPRAAYVMVPAYRENPQEEEEQEEQEDLCVRGKRQSPISIEYNIEPQALPVLGWEVTGGHVGQLRIRTQGVAGSAERFLELARGQAAMAVGGVRYELGAVHVHAPSEHAVGGRRYDLELQLVHTAPPARPGQPQRRLVVSALCEEYPESAEAVAALAGALSGLQVDQGGAVDLDLEAMALGILGQTQEVRPSSTNAQSYWRYAGSSTTPPCEETSDWVVLKNPLRVSLSDLAAIVRVVSQPNRPLQPLNGRVVLDSHPGA